MFDSIVVWHKPHEWEIKMERERERETETVSVSNDKTRNIWAHCPSIYRLKMFDVDHDETENVTSTATEKLRS